MQRFGYLLEELEVDHNLYRPILVHLEAQNYFPVLLSPKSEEKPGAVKNKWKVDLNIKLESDL